MTPAPRSRSARWRVAAIVVAVVIEMAIAGAHQYRARAPLRALERAALDAEVAPSQRLVAPLVLDPSNVLSWPGPWRDLKVDGTADLSPGAILEVRLRAPSLPDPVGSSARGVALWISADPRVATGVYLEDTGRLEPLAVVEGSLLEEPPAAERLDDKRLADDPVVDGASHPASAPSGAVSFSFGVAGHDFVAEVSDARGWVHRLRARADRFPGGGVQVLAAQGRSTLSVLDVHPSARTARIPPGFAAPEVLQAALAPVSLAFFVTVLGVVLLRARVRVAAAFGALTAAPLVLVLGFIDPLESTAAGSGGVWPGVAVCGALLLGLVLPLSRPRELTFVRLLFFGGLVGAAVLAARTPLLRPAPWPPDVLALNHLSYLEWSGERMDADLIPLLHPLVRRFHFHLADHQFRGRTFAVERTPGVARVLCIGTSSTWGLGVAPGEDYPTVLEGLLNAGQGAGELPVAEVMNAGVCGSVSDRLLRIFEHRLRAFAPDLITLNLRYNDGAVLCGPDEAAYLDQISAPDHTRSWLGDFGDRMDQQEGVRGFATIRQALVAGEPLTWPEDRGPTPAARFEVTLRRFAELAGAHGARVVFVIEPLNARWFFADELAAATRKVGSEVGADVVDPSAAILRAGGASLFLDAVHPTAVGHRVIAEALLAPVRSALAR